MGEWHRQAFQADLWHQDSHLPGQSSSSAASAVAGPEVHASLCTSVPRWTGSSRLSPSRCGHRAELRPKQPQLTGAGCPFHSWGSRPAGAALRVRYGGIAAPGLCTFWCYLVKPTFFSSDSLWKTPACPSLTLIRILITPTVGSFRRFFITHHCMVLYLKQPTLLPKPNTSSSSLL